MIPDENWLLRLPFIKDAIGVPVAPIEADTDYVWAMSTPLTGMARICFTYGEMEHRGTAFLDLSPGMNSVVINTGKLFETTEGFDVTLTDLVYLGGFQDFSHTTLLRGDVHCLVPMIWHGFWVRARCQSGHAK